MDNDPADISSNHPTGEYIRREREKRIVEKKREIEKERDVRKRGLPREEQG